MKNVTGSISRQKKGDPTQGDVNGVDTVRTLPK
jgi:hypothetical protein